MITQVFNSREEVLQDAINYYWGKPERKCVDIEGNCVYHPTETSEGCAIGRYIDPEIAYQLPLEVCTHADIIKALPAWLVDMDIEFLRRLQLCHDLGILTYAEREKLIQYMSGISVETVLSIKNYLLNSEKTINEIAKIHNCKPSTIHNIKYGSWSQITGFTGKEKWIRKDSILNRQKSLKESGLYEKQSIKVLQYDLKGNFIKEFNSISEASKETNTNRTSLTQCLNNKLKSANKFIWKKKNN